MKISIINFKEDDIYATFWCQDLFDFLRLRRVFAVCVDIDIRRTIDVFKVNRIVPSLLSNKSFVAHSLYMSISIGMLITGERAN